MPRLPTEWIITRLQMTLEEHERVALNLEQMAHTLATQAIERELSIEDVLQAQMVKLHALVMAEVRKMSSVMGAAAGHMAEGALDAELKTEENKKTIEALENLQIFMKNDVGTVEMLLSAVEPPVFWEAAKRVKIADPDKYKKLGLK